MKKVMIQNLSHNSKRFLCFLCLILLFTNASCLDSVNSPSDDDPSGTGIIGIESLPDILFGNASDESQIQVDTETFPDGSSVEFNLTGSTLSSRLRGCLLDEDTVLHDGGQAFASYLAGINIQPGSVLVSNEPPVEAVNVAVTINRLNTNDTESDFVTIQLQGVGLIPPEEQEIAVNPGEMFTPSPIGLEFLTVGIPPGTEVSFEVDDASLGSVTPTNTTVVGLVASGSAFTQYTPNNVQGSNRVTATLVLPNLHDFDLNCPDVPEEDRTVQEFVVITQSVPEPTPTPTPMM